MSLLQPCAPCSFLATSLPIPRERLDYVNEFLRMRGPDYTGVITNQSGWKFTFVHNLLQQTGGFTPQPFVAADNLTVALFVGEIYNYKHLEDLLQPSQPYASDGQC